MVNVKTFLEAVAPENAKAYDQYNSIHTNPEISQLGKGGSIFVLVTYFSWLIYSVIVLVTLLVLFARKN